MARNMNFSATLKLNSEQFKKGVKDIQRSISGLKSSFMQFAGALGAGIGFSQFISSLKDTTTKLSVAMNTLKNVSNITKETGFKGLTVEVSNYGDMLEYVRGVSHKYSQDLVAVTENFAQFHAACNKTNLSLDNQKYIFESLTKAAAAYHMSADRTRDMMNAVTQMMSKGKIAAEELRRQLGNSLPGAFNLMAASMGVTTSELDKLMRDGKVISEEVLPQFAAMLNEVTKNAEFDSLQLSINKLKNSWYELVNSSNTEKLFKGIIDGASATVNVVNRHLSGILKLIVSIGVAISGLRIGKSLRQSAEETRKAWIASFNSIDKKGERLAKKLNEANLNTKATNGPNPNFTQLKGTTLKQKAQSPKNLYYSSSIPNMTGKSIKEYNELIRAARDYNNLLLKQNELQKKLTGSSGFLTRRDLINIKEANKGLVEIGSQIEVDTKNAGKFGRAWGAVRSGIASAGKALKALAINTGIMAIIMLLSETIFKLIEVGKRAKEIRNIFSDYKETLGHIDTNSAQSAALLKSQYEIVKDTTLSDEVRLANLKKINETLGLTGDKMLKLDDLTKKDAVELKKLPMIYREIQKEIDKAADKSNSDSTRVEALNKANKQLDSLGLKQLKLNDLTKDTSKNLGDIPKIYDKIQGAIEKWVQATALQAKVQAIANKQAEAYLRISEIRASMSSAEERTQKREKNIAGGGWKGFWSYVGNYGLEPFDFFNWSQASKDNLLLGDSKRSGNAELEQLQKIVDDTIQQLKDLGVELTKVTEENKTGNPETDNGKIIEKYNKSVKELDNQYKEGVISQEDYGEELQKITTDTYKALAALGEWDKTLNTLGEKGKQTAQQIKKDFGSFSIVSDVEDYLKVAEKQADDEQKDYWKSIEDSFKEGADKATKALENYGQLQVDKNTQKEADKKQRDNTFDYMFSNIKEKGQTYSELEIEKLKGNLELKLDSIKGWEDIANNLQLQIQNGEATEQAKKELDDMLALIQKLKGESIDMQHLINLSEIEADIQDLKGRLREGTFDIFTDIADGADRLTSAIKNLKEEWDDPDTSGWEKLLAILNAFIQTIETLKGVVQAITLAREISAKIAEKSAAKETMANLSVIASEELKGKVAAKTAVAEAASSTAGIPIVGPIMAVAGIAAVLSAILAATGKFANGGVVGGNSKSGDKILARLNSGELILNQQQQNTLWGMLNSKSSGGNVNFEIKGDKLIGVLKNYDSKRRG